MMSLLVGSCWSHLELFGGILPLAFACDQCQVEVTAGYFAEVRDDAILVSITPYPDSQQ